MPGAVRPLYIQDRLSSLADGNGDAMDPIPSVKPCRSETSETAHARAKSPEFNWHGLHTHIMRADSQGKRVGTCSTM